MRTLEKTLFDALQDSALLAPLLDYVKQDNTLDLQFRGTSINIYYRGGSILKVTFEPKGFKPSFDYEYLPAKEPARKACIERFLSFSDWDNYFPVVKQAMDFYFTRKPKLEREYQQLVVRENNNSMIANSTDYFILDIEYNTGDKTRFDLIGVYWPSDSSARKLAGKFKPHLVVFEMKYGDKALSNTSGMIKHSKDFHTFTNDQARVDAFRKDMLTVFEQKRALGLIPCLGMDGKANSNKVTAFYETLDLVFLLVNHDPASGILRRELDDLVNARMDKQCSFISSNFLGYGLYKENLLSFDEFMNRFPAQI